MSTLQTNYSILNQESNKLKQQVVKVGVEYEQLSSKNQVLVKEKENREKDVENFKAESKKYSKQISSLEKGIQDLQQERLANKERICELEGEITSYQHKMEELSGNVQDHRQKKMQVEEDLQKQVDELKNDLLGKDQFILSLQTQIQEQNLRHSQLMQTSQNTQHQLELTEATLNDSKQRLLQLEDLLNKKSKDLQDAQLTLNSLVDQFNQSKNSSGVLETAQKKQSQIVTSLQDELQASTAELAKHKTLNIHQEGRIKHLEEDLARTSRERENLADRIKELERLKDDVNKQNETHQIKFKQLDYKHNELKEQYD